MHTILKSAVAGLVMLGAACGSPAAASEPSFDELDYGVLPLNSLVAEVSDCIAVFETADDPYWVPSQEVGAVDGYGISSNESKSTSELLAVDSNGNCGSAAERATLILDTLSFVQSEMIADGVYEGWSNCLAEQGFEGLSSPNSRSNYILSRIYAGSEAIPEDTVISRAESLLSTEAELALADLQCQQQEIAPQLGQMAEFQQQIINEAPADMQALLKG